MNKTYRTNCIAVIFSLIASVCPVDGQAKQRGETFPDGSMMGRWFNAPANANDALAGRAQYVITQHGVRDDSCTVQTEAIQRVIDMAAQRGGGVVVVPKGVFLSGSLFFRPGTALHLVEGAVLKGSDDISHFKIIDTRLEGRCIKYFAALVNAIGVDGFSITGSGTINGNGLRYWRSFWLRREVNPQCTNLEEMRPRLVYIAQSKDVRLDGVRLINSPFWTCHLYLCERARLTNLFIFAPGHPVKAPSSDAVDVDVCRDVLIERCRISVNDDAIALKGGKGPDAWQLPGNGANERVVIRHCDFDFCHSALTVGSESLLSRNIVMDHCTVKGAQRLLWLKMRPDTEQKYELIRVSNVQGNVGTMLYVKPWTQFFDLKGGKGFLKSEAHDIVMSNISLKCRKAIDIEPAADQFSISRFTFKNISVQATDSAWHCDAIDKVEVKDVEVNGMRM